MQRCLPRTVSEPKSFKGVPLCKTSALEWVEFTKRVIVYQEDLGTRSCGCLGSFPRELGGVSGKRWRRALSTVGRGPAGFFEIHPGVLSSPLTPKPKILETILANDLCTRCF